MHPAFSVILLTTLIGAGQGLFLALFTEQSYSAVELMPPQPGSFYARGSLIALGLLAAGLLASLFHLGRPERAWRAATQWRSSWLSREVIVLPAVMALVALYGGLHHLGWDLRLFDLPLANQLTLLVGSAATVAVFALFLCTGMIYAAVRFLLEWASPLTVINYLLLGAASGFTLATAYAARQAPELVNFFGGWAILITLAALVSRAAALLRNARLRRKSSLQSAIGVRHTLIQQKAMGMMGGSFNTREFFHGRGAAFLKAVKWLFLALVFPLPVALLWAGMHGGGTELLTAAFAVQYVGLLFERWFFFAQANHPQNLYYQVV